MHIAVESYCVDSLPCEGTMEGDSGQQAFNLPIVNRPECDEVMVRFPAAVAFAALEPVDLGFSNTAIQFHSLLLHCTMRPLPVEYPSIAKSLARRLVLNLVPKRLQAAVCGLGCHPAGNTEAAKRWMGI